MVMAGRGINDLLRPSVPSCQPRQLRPATKCFLPHLFSPHTIANPVVHAVFQTALIVFIGYSLFTQVAFNGRLCFANHFVCTARNYHRCRFRFSNVAVLSRPGRWKGEALNELVLEIFIGQLNVYF